MKEFTVTTGSMVQVLGRDKGEYLCILMGNEEYFWTMGNECKLIKHKLTDIAYIDSYNVGESVAQEDIVCFVNTPDNSAYNRKVREVGKIVNTDKLCLRYQIRIGYNDDLSITQLQKEIGAMRSCVPAEAIDVTDELCAEEYEFSLYIAYSLLETDAQRDARIVYEEDIVQKRKEEDARIIQKSEEKTALKRAGQIKTLQAEITKKSEKLKELIKQQDKQKYIG